MRIETIGDATLYLGDCLEILPTLEAGSVDAVVTDPPYGMGEYNKFGNRDNATVATEYTPIVGDFHSFDPSPFLKFDTVILFGANWFSDRLPAAAGWIIWDKKDGGKSDDFGDAEMAWVKGSITTRIIRHLWRGMIKASERDQKRVHPTQKPIAVMAWIIKNYVPAGATILDPFLGSGTTGVAALRLGRKFIGIEIEPKYFDIACRRIEQENRQLKMF